MNFLFQAKDSWRRPQVSFANVPAVTCTTNLVLWTRTNLVCSPDTRHCFPFLLSGVVCGLGYRLSFLIRDFWEKLGSRTSHWGCGSSLAWAALALSLTLLMQLPCCAATGAPCVSGWSLCCPCRAGLLCSFRCFCHWMHWKGAKVPTYLQSNSCEDLLKGREKSFCCFF